MNRAQPSSASEWPDVGAALPGHVRSLEAKVLLHAEGEPRQGITAVLDGCIALTKTLGDGRRQIIDIVGPGELFGFGVGPLHDCGAETITRARLRTWHPDGRVDGMLAATLLRQASRALSRQRDHAFLLGRKSARERVASGLIRLVEALGTEGDVFLCPLTRQDLGDWLGLVLETVSRALAALQRDGLIAIHEQTLIEIRDRRGLAAAAALPVSTTRTPPGPPRRSPARPLRGAA